MADFGAAAGPGQLLAQLDEAAGAGGYHQIGVNGQYVINQLPGNLLGNVRMGQIEKSTEAAALRPIGQFD